MGKETILQYKRAGCELLAKQANIAYLYGVIINIVINTLTRVIMNRLNTVLTVLLVIFFLPLVNAQEVQYSTSDYRIKPFGSLIPGQIKEDWNFRLSYLSQVMEGNPTYRQHLMQLKQESALRFPRKETDTKGNMNKTSDQGSTQVPDPVIKRNFQGNAYSYSVPNDNTLAISNDGQLISAINTNLYFYDMNQDSLLRSLSLNNFAAPLQGISTHQYDPRLLYDPHQDRFIIVFLAGASSDTKTNIVVAFSETSDMMGNWNLYSLPGNPLDDTSWTDFPAIALTEDELFITVNLLNYGTSWQTSFKQSVIWQVNKFDGYSGHELTSRLWSEITFDKVPIRNMHPIQGGDKLYGPNIYLLSNRNFTLYSDSVFLIEVTGNLRQPDARLNITCLKSDVGYGAPPDARQPKTTNRLATNDARVLGGFLYNNTIQFVGNTIDTTTGSAVIYHGVLSSVKHKPFVRLKLITEPYMEFGYPNISFTGNTLFSQQSIIGFNHTGDSIYPGVSAVFYDGIGGYSNFIRIKEGDQFIDILSGTYERWGDYTGNQRKYNEPGVVWISGMYGIRVGMNRRLGTQIAEVVSQAPEIPVVKKGDELDASLYPNPVSDLFGMEFTLEKSMDVIIELKSVTGQQEHRFFEGNVPAGKNALTFSTQHLSQGLHLLFITDAKGKVLFSEKVVKVKE